MNIAILIPVEINGTYFLKDKSGRTFKCTRKDCDPQEFLRVNATKGNAIRVSEENGGLRYRACNASFFDDRKNTPVDNSFDMLMADIVIIEQPEISVEKQEILNFLNTSINLKPKKLKMSQLKWKFLVRSVMRGKNIMMTGPAGTGKTFAVQSLAVAFPDRKLFTINLGSTQDPRATLIGNTGFSKENGTYFSESYFVKAIQTPKAIILMDELSRAHPEAMNILMPVLDEGQRYLRLDEADGSPTIKVAEGVSFIATANIGNEYTATRVLDRALIDRFTIIEMDVLSVKDEIELLKEIYTELSDKKITAIAEIADATRKEIKSESSKIGTIISTRATVELAGLLNDGFTLAEAAEAAIFPFFPDEGGVDSERTFIKQLVQRYIEVDKDEDLFNIREADSLNDLSNVKPF